MLDNFLKKWLNKDGIYFPGDKEILRKVRTNNYQTVEQYIESDDFNNGKEKKLHLGLSPLPFLGNLSHASTFILTLNPGFHFSDYFTERNSIYRQKLEENFNQTIKDFPLFFLNPKLGFHAGYDYWNTYLKYPREALCKHLGFSQVESQQFLAQEIAILELIPYHSKSEPWRFTTILSLPSVKAIINIARSILQEKALNEEILILIFRKKDKWNLVNGKNILKKFTRTPSLNPENTNNGKILLEFLINQHYLR